MRMLLLRLQVVLVVLAIGRLGFATLALPFDAAASGEAGCCDCDTPLGGGADTCDDDEHEGGEHEGGEHDACSPGCADCHCCPAPLVAVVPAVSAAPALVRVPRAAPPHTRGDRTADPERIDRPPRAS